MNPNLKKERDNLALLVVKTQDFIEEWLFLMGVLEHLDPSAKGSAVHTKVLNKTERAQMVSISTLANLGKQVDSLKNLIKEEEVDKLGRSKPTPDQSSPGVAPQGDSEG